MVMMTALPLVLDGVRRFKFIYMQKFGYCIVLLFSLVLVISACNYKSYDTIGSQESLVSTSAFGSLISNTEITTDVILTTVSVTDSTTMKENEPIVLPKDEFAS